MHSVRNNIHPCRLRSLLLPQAILNDCADAIQLTTLAVAWGELPILEDVLERTAANIGSDSVGISLALQLALLRRDVRMVGMLIDFNATPRHIELERFFTQERCIAVTLPLHCLTLPSHCRHIAVT